MTSSLDRTAPGLDVRRRRARSESSEDYQQRRAELLRAAASVFHAKGFTKATMSDIAEAAGTDRATVYYYVENKLELFIELTRDALQAIESGFRAIVDDDDLPPAEQLRRLIVHNMVQFAAHDPYLHIYAMEDMSRLDVDQPWQTELAAHAQRLFEIVRAVVAAGLADGTLRSTLGAGVIAQTILGAVAWSNRWFDPSRGGDPRELGEGLASLLLDGLISRGDGATAPRTGRPGRA
ncbi:MAG: TetR/AcrR family transcriptional regulator [Acidimicrobiia bacterium]